MCLFVLNFLILVVLSKSFLSLSSLPLKPFPNLFKRDVLILRRKSLFAHIAFIYHIFIFICFFLNYHSHMKLMNLLLSIFFFPCLYIYLKGAHHSSLNILVTSIFAPFSRLTWILIWVRYISKDIIVSN